MTISQVTPCTPLSAPVSSIWKQPISLEALRATAVNTAIGHLGIEFLEVGDDFIRARVPMDARTVQPYGLLHGGVAVVLAETLGSCGAAFAAPAGHRVVGLDINANHLKGTSSVAARPRTATAARTPSSQTRSGCRWGDGERVEEVMSDQKGQGGGAGNGNARQYQLKACRRAGVRRKRGLACRKRPYSGVSLLPFLTTSCP